MRIAYYANETNRKLNKFNIREVHNAFALNSCNLICDDLCFWLDDQQPYGKHGINGVLLSLMKRGYADLRNLSLVEYGQKDEPSSL